MSHTKEYRGEKIEAGLTARLIPPGAQYSDSFCWLILTERHLYILEDNYDGTYNELYAFFIERIQDMEAQVKGLKYKKSVLGELFSNGILSLFGGLLYASGKKKDNGVCLSLHMMTVWENVISCILKICRQIQITW